MAFVWRLRERITIMLLGGFVLCRSNNIIWIWFCGMKQECLYLINIRMMCDYMYDANSKKLLWITILDWKTENINMLCWIKFKVFFIVRYTHKMSKFGVYWSGKIKIKWSKKGVQIFFDYCMEINKCIKDIYLPLATINLLIFNITCVLRNM